MPWTPGAGFFGPAEMELNFCTILISVVRSAIAARIAGSLFTRGGPLLCRASMRVAKLLRSNERGVHKGLKPRNAQSGEHLVMLMRPSPRRGCGVGPGRQFKLVADVTHRVRQILA